MPRLLKKKPIVISGRAPRWIVVAAALGAAVILDRREPHRWHAAIVWIVVTFYGVLVFSESRLRYWSFWVLWTLLLVLHLFLMWVIFTKILAAFWIGMVFVIPFAFVESILLLRFVWKMQDKVLAETASAGKR
jgi:hypothetical protein